MRVGYRCPADKGWHIAAVYIGLYNLAVSEWFLARVIRRMHIIAIVILSVCPSMCHTGDPRDTLNLAVQSSWVFPRVYSKRGS